MLSHAHEEQAAKPIHVEDEADGGMASALPPDDPDGPHDDEDERRQEEHQPVVTRGKGQAPEQRKP